MVSKIANPTIEWCSSFNKKCLLLRFSGEFQETDATKAIGFLNKLFTSIKSDKTDMVWDTLEMTHYNSAARIVWQQMLKQNKQSIGSIYVITKSLFVKAGVRLMSMFSSLDIQCLSSMNEIDFGSNKIA